MWHNSKSHTFFLKVISAPMCIEHCRGAEIDYKYALADTDKCSCATDISFDAKSSIKNAPESPKWLTNKCGLSGSKTMIGNSENNVVALYNIEYSRQLTTAKLGAADCRTMEHEMFYSSYGMDRFALQAEIFKPVLKVDCNYKGSDVCLMPLLQTISESALTSEVGGFGSRSNIRRKMYLNSDHHLSYINLYTGNGVQRELFVETNSSPDGDLITIPTVKLVISFPSLTLIQGIWWSNARARGNGESVITKIETFEFSFPPEMGGQAYKSEPIIDIRKGISDERNKMDFYYFSRPILTTELKMSVFHINTVHNRKDSFYRMRFTMELFGCNDYILDKSKCIKKGIVRQILIA